MVLVETVARQVPGVVGQAESVEQDSFFAGLLDHPHYTRPPVFRGLAVPEVLLSGDHAAITRWRRREALRQTLRKRPDLLAAADLGAEDLQAAGADQGAGMTTTPERPRVALALVHHPVIRDRFGTVGATSVTPLNVHDLARAARTYGVAPLYVVTPLLSQQALVGRILSHYREGYGAGRQPDPRGGAARCRALGVDQRGAGRPVPAGGRLSRRRRDGGPAGAEKHRLPGPRRADAARTPGPGCCSSAPAGVSAPRRRPSAISSSARCAGRASSTTCRSGRPLPSYLTVSSENDIIRRFTVSVTGLQRRIDMDIIRELDKDTQREDIPPFRPGDSVKVHTKVVEGEKERIQIFEGLVVRMRSAGAGSSFTVRKLSYGTGVERIFPTHSPMLGKIEIVKSRNVRRAKLYFTRNLVGKAATRF